MNWRKGIWTSIECSLEWLTSSSEKAWESSASKVAMSLSISTSPRGVVQWPPG
jgi:hypothetical protein